jgi:hypothetical protein
MQAIQIRRAAAARARPPPLVLDRALQLAPQLQPLAGQVYGLDRGRRALPAAARRGGTLALLHLP